MVYMMVASIVMVVYLLVVRMIMVVYLLVMMTMIVIYMLVVRLPVRMIMAVYLLVLMTVIVVTMVEMMVYLLVVRIVVIMMAIMVIGGEENDVDDGPPVGGERAGLVRADRRRVAHRLARVQVPHQVVVAHHFLQNAFVKTVSGQNLF